MRTRVESRIEYRLRELTADAAEEIFQRVLVQAGGEDVANAVLPADVLEEHREGSARDGNPNL